MKYFMAICNPVDVWDFKAFFDQSPTNGYWVVTKKVYGRMSTGDTLYLRITSKSSYVGICGRFSISAKHHAEVPNGFWRAGRKRDGLQPMVKFSVVDYFPANRITPDDLRMNGVSSESRLIRVPQTLATELTTDDGRLLDRLIDAKNRSRLEG